MTTDNQRTFLLLLLFFPSVNLHASTRLIHCIYLSVSLHIVLIFLLMAPTFLLVVGIIFSFFLFRFIPWFPLRLCLSMCVQGPCVLFIFPSHSLLLLLQTNHPGIIR